MSLIPKALERYYIHDTRYVIQYTSPLTPREISMQPPLEQAEDTQHTNRKERALIIVRSKE